MTGLAVFIKEFGDPPAWPELKDPLEATLEGMCILERGTVGGKTSVAFKIKLPDGKDVIVQTTAAVFDGALHALKGAEIRFAEKHKF